MGAESVLGRRVKGEEVREKAGFVTKIAKEMQHETDGEMGGVRPRAGGREVGWAGRAD